MTGKRVRDHDRLVGAGINQRMWLRRISQRKVAEALGVEQGSVSRRLRGKQPFTVGELFVVAELLGVEVAQLLNLDPLAPIMETGERVEVGPKLPRLDSNQQPFG